MIPIRLSRLVVFAIVFACGCSSRPVRIVAGTNDSLVVNNRLSVPLPVYGVDARGRRHTIAGLQYQRIGGDSISLTPDGRVTCSRRADARVTVSHEPLTKTFSLLCRPILAVGVKRIWVLSDGDSAALDPTAIGMEGEHEPLIAGVATVQDTSIAYVDHGRVFGRHAGETRIVIDAGDCTNDATVEVNQSVATSLALAPFQIFVGGPVELAPGESRTWTVAPGPYIIWTGGDTDRGVAFGTSNINCARDGLAGQYSCIALANGTVIVRNMRRTGFVRGSVFVSRSLDPVRDSSYIRDHPRRAPESGSDGQRVPPGWCNPRFQKKTSQARPAQTPRARVVK
jgi:hypothetical protein